MYSIAHPNIKDNDSKPAHPYVPWHGGDSRGNDSTGEALHVQGIHLAEVAEIVFPNQHAGRELHGFEIHALVQMEEVLVVAEGGAEPAAPSNLTHHTISRHRTTIVILLCVAFSRPGRDRSLDS